MESLYKSIKGIICFLIIVLISQVAVGDKFAQTMTLVILFSMLIKNSDKLANYLTKVTNNLT